MSHQSGPCGVALCYSSKQGDSGRLAWTQSWGAPLLISAPGKTLKMSAATSLCVKSQVILSRVTNHIFSCLSFHLSIPPPRPREDWWRDGGKNQCFPASCVMFRDGWCADGSFSWIHPSERGTWIHSIYFPSSLTWFLFDFPAFRHWTAGGRWKRMFSALVDLLACFLRDGGDFQPFCFREYDFHPYLSFYG